MTETLCVFLVLGAMLALERLRTRRRWPWAVAASMLLGMAVLTRANIGPFVPVAIAWLVFYGRDNLRLAIRHGLIISALVGVMWGGWVWRNYSAFGAFIPFTTQGGGALYGVYNDVTAERSLGLIYGYWIDNTPQLPAGQILTEVELDQLQRTLALTWMRAHPRQTVEMALMQAVHLWRPEFVSELATYFVIVPVGLAGLILTLRRAHPAIVLWVLLASMLTALAIVTVGVPRYRLPLHPLLSVTTAVLVQVIATKLGAGWQRLRLRLTGQRQSLSSDM